MLEQNILPEYIVVCRGCLTAEGERFLDEIQLHHLPFFECDAKRFAKLTDTVHSQGFLAVARDDFFESSDEIIGNARFLVYLDGISDPGNLGTIIRTAVAFGVDLLAVSPNSAEFANPKTIRASAGLIFRLPLKKVDTPETFFDQVKSNSIELIGSDAAAEQDLETLPLEGKVCLAIGSEARGLAELTRSRCDALFCVRTKANVESLNAATAAAIAIHNFAGRMKLV